MFKPDLLPPSLLIHLRPPHQIKKGGLLKGLVFKWAFGRKKYYMEQGWRYDQVRQYRGGGTPPTHHHMSHAFPPPPPSCPS